MAGNGNLSQVGSQLGLGACINLNPGTIAVSARAMATAVEAILGAVHQDGGDAALARVMADIGLTHEFLAPS